MQSKIKDDYRGRVFAFYDVAVNAGIITGAVAAALLLPANGATAVLPAVIGLAYLVETAELGLRIKIKNAMK